jgi:hypothetical protein
MMAGLEQRAGAAHLQPLDHRGLGHVGLGQENRLVAGSPRGQGHGERAAHRTQAALETDLAQDHLLSQPLLRQLPAGDQDAQRDGKVERRSVLADIGWREVDGDPFEGEGKTGVGERGTDPLPAFLHRTLRQPDCRERRQTTGDVHFDVYRIRIDTQYRRGLNSGEHDLLKESGSRT